MAAATAALERKQTQFLAQFADAVFAQWTQAAEKERFWQNAAFLRGLLEEAVAKLPKIALKGHLMRELQPAVAELKQLLETRYTEFQTRENAQPSAKRAGALELLSEVDVERALATADAGKRRELAALLALDEVVLGDIAQDAPASVALIETYAAQLQLVSARRYEASSELAHKRGYFVQRIVHCGAQLVRKWTAAHRGNWSCSPVAASSTELLRLRAVLQQIASSDAVAANAAALESASVLPASWSVFHRPSESALFTASDYDAELAKLFGLLLALAVYFPIVSDDDDSDSEATSDDASEDSDDSGAARTVRTGAAAAKRNAPLDALTQAKLSVRHVALAARARADASWLVAVLTFLHELPKPASYNDDDDARALDVTDQRALLDCLADVYARAFADLSALERFTVGHESKASDWALFRTVVCIRRAAHFMRAERRQSVPAVTTAMAKLASVPLPVSFWQWLAHVKRTYAVQPPAVRDVMKRFMKGKASKTASALLSAADVTDAELDAIAANYDAFLTRSSDDAFLVVGTSTDASDSTDAAAAPDTLFFVDSAGGKKNKSKSNASKNKNNASKSKSTSVAVAAPEKRSASAPVAKRAKKAKRS